MHGINPLPLLGTRQRILCAIGVVVTSVPSKHLWRVRVSYGAPNRKSHTAKTKIVVLIIWLVFIIRYNYSFLALEMVLFLSYRIDADSKSFIYNTKFYAIQKNCFLFKIISHLVLVGFIMVAFLSVYRFPFEPHSQWGLFFIWFFEKNML